MSSSRKSPRVNHFVPCVEPLEARDVPAGNVTVSALGGILHVTGDDAANAIWIAGTGRNSVVIRPLDGDTTINGGSAPVWVGGVGGGYNIRMNGGNDNLLITGTRAEGALLVDLGAGDDQFGLSDAGHREHTEIRAGDGNDVLVINGFSVFRRYAFVDTGAGDDAVVVEDVGAMNFSATNPSGNDTFDNRGATLVNQTITGFNFSPPRTPPEPEVPPAPEEPPAPGAAPTPTVSTTASASTKVAPIPFTITFDQDVNGFATDDLAVTNGTVTNFTTVDARTYEIQVTPTGEGEVTVQVVAEAATSAEGIASVASNSATVVFDTVAPVPAITPLTTNDTTPTLTGTVNEAGATVRVTVSGQTVTATVTGTTWSATLTTPLLDGTYAVTVTATDAAGNTSAPATLASGLVIDTIAPARPTVFNLAPLSDTGAVGDLRTEQSTVALSGLAEAGSTIRLYRLSVPGLPGSTTPVATTTAGNNGAYIFSNITLTAGPNSFAVRAFDAAGNASPTFAQTFGLNAAPIAIDFPPVNLSLGTPTQSFQLTDFFFDQGEQILRFELSYPGAAPGTTLDFQLFGTQSPDTVTNFLAYAENGDPTRNYDGSIFHRLAALDGSGPPDILQGGGFKFDDSGTTPQTAFPIIQTFAPIANEPEVSNTRGTIAMAKGSAPNSATSQFYFNLTDNSTALDVVGNAGGFTVFGQVLNGGLQTLDAIAALPTLNLLLPLANTVQTFPSPVPVSPTADSSNAPGSLNPDDLVIITSARLLSDDEKLTFEVIGNTNPLAATASVDANANLTITRVAAGTTVITVRATDLDGATVQKTITVTVT